MPVSCARGQLEKLVSLLVLERLSLERAVVAASKARAAAAAAPAASTPTADGVVMAGGDSNGHLDMEKQLTLLTQRYESQVHAIRQQVNMIAPRDSACCKIPCNALRI
eukprot:COSAG02_NODE_5905_length_3945_cov_7.102127_2_plen_108_part_00